MPGVTILGGSSYNLDMERVAIRRGWMWDGHTKTISLRLTLGEEDGLSEPVEQYHDYDAQTGICRKCGNPFGHGHRQTCRGYR